LRGLKASKPMNDQSSLLDNEPRKPDPSRAFVFAHKVFAAPKAYFKLDEQSLDPVLAVDLGDLKATLGFETLRRSFGIAPDGPDGRLLEAVARGLKYVRRIRPGDAIPAELLDGSASWKVEPRHVAISKGRVVAGLLAWIGQGAKAESSIEFAALADDDAVKLSIQSAFGKLAARLGLPDDRREEVVDMVDLLAEELAYIEALRERVAFKRKLVDLFKRLRGLYKRDRNALGQIERAVLLLERPVLDYEYRLGMVDAQTGETANAIVNLHRQIDFVRETRDLLHSETMRWEDLLTSWEDSETDRSPAQQRKIADTYRFAARHFPAASEWSTG
jgi:hypothetical protein